MKKFNGRIYKSFFSILAITITHSQLYPKNQLPDEKNVFIEQYAALQYKKGKNATIYFTPDQEFGGGAAHGQYNHKEKTAVISYNNKDYIFKDIIEDRNPTLSQVTKKKQIPENMISLGSFTKRLIRGMPVTMYLYGLLTQEVTTQDTKDTLSSPFKAQEGV